MAILDIKLSRGKGDRFDLVLGFDSPHADAYLELTRQPAVVVLDPQQFLPLQLDAQAYGQALAEALFADPDARAAFAAGRAKAVEPPLRVRLCLDASCEPLHALFWERLCDPESGQPLFLDERTLFSRYLDSRDWRAVPQASNGIHKALVVVAGPSDLDADGLPALDRERERRRAGEGLLGLDLRLLTEPGEAHLAAILAELGRAPDLLYLVCHGSFVRGRPVLWLETPQGRSDRVSGDDLAARLGEQARLPRLVVLVSFENAGADADADVLSALGLALARAGVPAVLTMQGLISEQTAAAFLPVFFGELRRHGFLDRAMAVARGAVRRRPDGSLPVLFSRLESGCLWRPNSLARLKEIYDGALELAEDKREAYLRETCAGDAALRDQVDALLAALEQTQDGTSQLQQALYAPLITAKTGAEAGSRIGPYRLEEELGRGGMGVVYRAVRDDGELQMTVAVKLIKHNRAAPEFVARFRRERQLLADLRHPHIAQLLDAGTTPKGVPYLIMDYVDGQSITGWCRRHTPSQHVCLRLFRKLVEAVAVAHRKGVIHRDIKPANVLVNRDGEPVLLDFGIAHVAADEDTVLTQAGHLVMTPAYAAPEQQRGAQATPRFDIFAMGLLFLEMLTGQRMRCEGGNLSEWLQAIGRAEATSVEGEQEPGLQPFLSKSLVAFLSTAMAHDPNQRFADCEAMLAHLDLLQAEAAEAQATSIVHEVYRFDLLLLCTRHDEAVVAGLAKKLTKQGLRPTQLSTSLTGTASLLLEVPLCLVCLGTSDQVPWQEVEVTLASQVRTGQLRVIPLLLPEARRPERESLLPFFLRRQTWLAFPQNDIQLSELYDQLQMRETRSTAGSFTQTCPFRGLEVFREEDARFFFGREAVTQRLHEHLHHHPFLAVLGPSGSGKSSLVQAGLLPLLREEGVIPTLFTPNVRPLEELASALCGLYPEERRPPAEQLNRRLHQDERALHFMVRELREQNPHRICLVIGQFEEVFTLAIDDLETRSFLHNLLYAVEQANSGILVVLTLRSDFIGKCVVWPELSSYIADNMVLLEPMDEQALTHAVVAPAKLAGLEFEPGLADVIITDVSGATGELPLLEHALLELYERRNGKWLTAAAYAEIGGIEGALAQRAENEFAALNAEQQQVLRKMFTLCLINPGEGAEDTRRRARRGELLAVGRTPEIPAALLAQWTQARLLTGSRDEARGLDLIDVAHEALIRKWDRIKTWMAEDFETARLLGRLRRRAATWEEADHHEDFLLRGGELYQMQDLCEREQSHLGERERQFVKTSLDLEQRERRRRRNNRNLLAALLVAAVISLMFTFFFSRDAIKSEAAAIEATHLRTLAESARKEGNYHLSLAFNAMAGTALDKENPTEAWLQTLAALSQDIPTDKDLPEPLGRFLDSRLHSVDRLLWTSPVVPKLVGVAASADGRLLALAGVDGLVRLVDSTNGKQIGLLSGATWGITHLIFSPDGLWLAAASQRQEVYLWRTDDGNLQVLNEGFSGEVTALAFSPDGSVLACGGEHGLLLLHAMSGEPTKHHKLKGPIHDLVYDGEARLNAATDMGVMRHGPADRWEKRTAAAGGATSLCWSPRLGLVSGWSGGEVVFHDRAGWVGTGAHEGPVLALAADPTDRFLVSCGAKTMLRWGDGAESPAFEGTAVSLATTGRLVLSVNAGGKLQGHDLQSKQTLDLSVGHDDNVSTVCFSPDGRRLASASRNGTIAIWDQHGETPPRFLKGHTAAVYSMAFSPDGSRLASASFDHTIRLWRTSDGALAAVLQGHTDAVLEVAFSPNGSRLASASYDHTVRLWRSSDGAATAVLQGHTAAVRSVAFSPDGSRLASASSDHTVRLWRTSDGAVAAVLRGHTDTVRGVTFSPDGSRLASHSIDHTMRLWRTSDGAAAAVLRGHTAVVRGVAFSPDGSRLASASYDQTVRLWRTSDGTAAAVIQGHTAGVLGVAFSPDGSRLASHSIDHTVRLWRTSDGTAAAVLRGHTSTVNYMAFSPDGSRLASASADHTVRLWRTSDGAAAAVLKDHTAAVMGVAFSADGARLASASYDKTVRLWRSSDGTADAVLQGHTSTVNCVAFSADGSRLASSSYDQTVRLWRTSDGTAAAVLQHSAAVYGVAFSPDGARLASASDDQTVRLWRTSDGAADGVFQGHTDSVVGVAFSPDGSRLASASSDKTVRLWRTSDGTTTAVLHGHTAVVFGVAFSPDGSQLASASSDQTVMLWRTSDGTADGVLQGHTSRVYGVTFSPDGNYLASTSADHTAIIWDLADNRPLAVLQGHEGELGWFPAFSPDGRLFATSSDDQTVRLWQMDQLLLPPTGTSSRNYYGRLLERSLYVLGYRRESFRLIPQPHLRLQLPQTSPQADDFLDQPRPPHIPLAQWLMQDQPHPPKPGN